MLNNRHFVQLSNGDRHYFDEPFTPDIKSIAKSLSYINRFNGHVGTYSVAQHSILVALKLPPELQLSGLLHDATEAYIGDIASPLKKYMSDKGSWQYDDLEKYYHYIIDSHFKVDTTNPLVKEVDMRMLVTEAETFGVNSIIECVDIPPYDFKVVRLSPEDAYTEFLSLFARLSSKS